VDGVKFRVATSEAIQLHTFFIVSLIDSYKQSVQL